MSAAFGPQAARLYAVAAQTLGWRPADFWAATPAELAGALLRPGDAGARPITRDELERMMETGNG